MEIRTLQDLKDFLGTLTEEQLTQSAGIAVDDEYHNITEAGFNDEGMVWNPDMIDGYIPVDEYVEEEQGYPLNDEYNRQMPKGSIVIISA